MNIITYLPREKEVHSIPFVCRWLIHFAGKPQFHTRSVTYLAPQNGFSEKYQKRRYSGTALQ